MRLILQVLRYIKYCSTKSCLLCAGSFHYRKNFTERLHHNNWETKHHFIKQNKNMAGIMTWPRPGTNSIDQFGARDPPPPPPPPPLGPHVLMAYGACARSHSLEPLQWRHNEHDGISNHHPHDYLLNRLFRHISKTGNSPVTGEFPAQMASNAELVFIWWRHHEYWVMTVTLPEQHLVKFGSKHNPVWNIYPFGTHTY